MRATVLAWEHAGEGEPLVLLHGIGTTRDDFVQVRGQFGGRLRRGVTAVLLRRSAVPQNPHRKRARSAREPSRLAALRGRGDD
jgi:hypothetical protein